MTEETRIQFLRRELHRHNHNYYVLNAPEISDQEFDSLMAELIQLEAKHPEMADPDSPSVRVGSDLSHEFVQVRHRYPMLSLGNTYNRDDVQTFYDRVREGLGGRPFEVCCELKFDGLSISLTYEHGRLTRAVTRGDGISGDDVTANVKTIRSIPLCLPPNGDYPDSFEIRGEVLMPWTSFERLNREREAREEPLFANPRNAASGTLKSKSSAVVAKRHLDAYLYYLLGDTLPATNHYDNLQQAARWGFKVSTAMTVAKTLDDIYAYIDHWDVARKELPFATDGIVLKVNDLRQQETLGYTTKNPRWAIAYKFQAERACTRLNAVTFQVGRTGAVTPVANMEPVLLAGTVVKRASLHNEDIILQLDLHVGDMVYVEKAGEIIPQIVGVDKDSRSEQGQRVEFIKECPICHTPLVRYEDEAATYCPNDSCPPQLKGRIEHFISRDAMDINSLGPETVDDYFERGLIHDAADLYNLTLASLCGESNRTRVRSAQKILDGIAASREVGFERVLYALGIRFVGKVAAKAIAQHCGSLEWVMTASTDQLLCIDGVGKVIAQSVVDYFHDEKNLDFVHRLVAAGVQTEVVAPTTLSDRLAGQTIVISGTFQHHSREEYKNLIALHGGKLASSISKKTTFVLAGENMGPAKAEKAHDLGVKLLSEADFLALLPQERTLFDL